MKNFTFLIGLSWLLYGAMFFGYPDWDVKVSLLMAFSTYLFAERFWQNMMSLGTNLTLRDLLGAWWCVDGSYALYWTITDPTVAIREGQWLMSLCLFLLCGAVWTAAPTLHQARDNFAAVVAEMRGLLLFPQDRAISSRSSDPVVSQHSTAVSQQPEKARQPSDSL